MAAPIQDFTRVLQALFRFFRIASYGLIGLTVVFLGFRVAEAYQFFAGLHRWGGVAFLVLFFAALFWFVGRPLYRFFKVPAAVRPPELPPMAERTSRDVVKHLDFVERYLDNLRRNPMWDGAPEDIDKTVASIRALREEAGDLDKAGMQAFSERMATLEQRDIAKLLEPLDKQVRAVIRQEALAVGVATAVSWNGTIDAFIVLWRNCNLASRIARIYYGRPGVRGTLGILRDVSAATLASAYLGDLTEMAGTALSGAFGKTVGAVGGPLLEGGLNAVATLRIGYLTRARCRSFSAWNEATRGQAVTEAFKEAGRFSKDVVGEVVKTVGGGILKLPGKLLAKVADSLGSIFKPAPTGGDAAPATG